MNQVHLYIKQVHMVSFSFIEEAMQSVAFTRNYPLSNLMPMTFIFDLKNQNSSYFYYSQHGCQF